MWGWRSSQTVVVSLAAGLFIGLCLAPLAALTALATAGPGAVRAVPWLDDRQWRLLANTTVLGLGTAALATTIGAPLGLVLARAELSHKAWVRLALSVPALLPPYVAAMAWTYLGGPSGLATALLGRDPLSDALYSLPAAVLILSLVFYPLPMLATEVALRQIEGRLEEAALTMAGPRRVLWRITAPLALPGVLAAALIVFVLAVSEFGVPGVLRVRVYTTEIFTAFAAFYDVGRAVRLALPLLAVSLVVGLAASTVLGDRLVRTRAAANTPSPLRFERGALAWPMIAAVLGLSLFAPLAVLVREAAGSRSLAAVMAGSGEAVAGSLRLSAAGATAIVGIAMWLGYARARASGGLARAIDVLLVVTFAVPGTMVGVGLIGLWNRPGSVGSLYRTEAIVVMGYLARFLPVAVLALAASVRGVPRSHEDAAAVTGARWMRSMWTIVLPQMRPALIAAWVVAFVLASGELGVSILVAPPGEATLPIRVYTIIANTPTSTVAALALLQVAVVLGPLALLGALAARREAA
jgi:iron(III) transport system permease protein